MFVAVLGYGGVFKPSVFKKTIKNIPTNKLVKNIDTLKSSKSLKGITGSIKLKNLSPADELTKTAEAIANKSPVGNKIMATSDPLYAMNLYAKGGDKLFDDIGLLTKRTMQLGDTVRTKLPSISKLPKLSEQQLFNQVVTVTKRTGKFGVDTINAIARIAKDNPKSAVAGVMYGWYLSDPVGFKNRLDQFGGSMEEFAKHIGSLVGNTAIGVTSGIIEGVATSVKEKLSTTTILVLIGLFFVWILLKYRDILFSLQKLFISKKDDKDEDVPKRKKNGGSF